MKKKPICLLLALVMTLCLLPSVSFAIAGTPYIDENGEQQYAAATILSSSSVFTLEDGGWYTFDADLEIPNGMFEVQGTANLILPDGLTFTSNREIVSDTSATLNIYCQSEGTGTLIVNASGRQGYSQGNLNVYGGNVTFKGVDYDVPGDTRAYAGIDTCGTIAVYGGNVTAICGNAVTGGSMSNSAIRAIGANVQVHGGKLTAIGGDSEESTGSIGLYLGFEGTLEVTGDGEFIAIAGKGVTNGYAIDGKFNSEAKLKHIIMVGDTAPGERWDGVTSLEEYEYTSVKAVPSHLVKVPSNPEGISCSVLQVASTGAVVGQPTPDTTSDPDYDLYTVYEGTPVMVTIDIQPGYKIISGNTWTWIKYDNVTTDKIVPLPEVAPITGSATFTDNAPTFTVGTAAEKKAGTITVSDFRNIPRVSLQWLDAKNGNPITTSMAAFCATPTSVSAPIDIYVSTTADTPAGTYWLDITVADVTTVAAFGTNVTVSSGRSPREPREPRPAAPAAEKPWFKDVEKTDWCYDAIKYVYEKGLMVGTDELIFSPKLPTGRAMAAQILWNLAGQPHANYLMSFSDVDADQWYTEAIRWATSEKIFSGYPDGAFAPGKPISREELAVILYNYAKTQGKGFKGSWMFLSKFNDRAQIGEWAMEAVLWCETNGIINGRLNGNFDPKAQATRAEAACMFRNFAEYLGK